ncbi:MAG: hypothetical protein AAF532_04645 [Planctomycetota bacterium]
MAWYEFNGVRLSHPEGWEITREETGAGVTVTVSPGGASFWAVTKLPFGVRADEAVETVTEAYREEYDDLDVRDAEPTADAAHAEELLEAVTAARPGPGVDLEWSVHDLPVAGRVRTVEIADVTLLVTCQADAIDWDDLVADFEMLTGSLRAAEDD